MFRRPTLLFDDKEDNIALVRNIGVESDGIVVKRTRRNENDPHIEGFRYEPNPFMWIPVIQDFCDAAVARGWNVLPAHRAEVQDPTPTPPSASAEEAGAADTVERQELPADWEAVWSEIDQEFWYRNTRTGVAMWERPDPRAPSTSLTTLRPHQ